MYCARHIDTLLFILNGHYFYQACFLSGEPMNVTGISSQCSNDSTRVTTYHVYHSMDGKTFEPFMAYGDKQVFSLLQLFNRLAANCFTHFHTDSQICRNCHLVSLLRRKCFCQWGYLLENIFFIMLILITGLHVCHWNFEFLNQ